MHDTLQELVFDAPDVCYNCFRIVRQERDRPDPRYRRSDVTVEEAKWTRNRQTTSVEFGPADHVRNSKGIFCECGVEGSYARVWEGDVPDEPAFPLCLVADTDPDVDRERFRDLLQNVMRTLERKGVSFDRQTFAAHALQARRNEKTVNQCLSEGLTYALTKAEVESRTQATA